MAQFSPKVGEKLLPALGRAIDVCCWLKNKYRETDEQAKLHVAINAMNNLRTLEALLRADVASEPGPGLALGPPGPSVGEK